MRLTAVSSPATNGSDATAQCFASGRWWEFNGKHARTIEKPTTPHGWLLLFLPACVRDASTEHPAPHFRGDKHVEFKFFIFVHSEIYSINQSARSLMFYKQYQLLEVAHGHRPAANTLPLLLAEESSRQSSDLFDKTVALLRPQAQRNQAYPH